MAQLQIDISQGILAQFAAQLEVQKQENALILNANIGVGEIKLVDFPDTLELYHFSFKLKNSLQLDSLNPRDSDYILLNINLSERAIEKTVNGQELDIQKYLPSGILCYPPNTKVSSVSPINTDFEIVLVRFHKDLLRHYFAENRVSSLKLETPLSMKI